MAEDRCFNRGRLERFEKLMQRYQQSPEDYDEGEEEDPRPYFTGEVGLARFVCVTVNYSSRSGATYYFLPTFDSVASAALRATEYAEDDIFEELPVEVFDLDRECSYRPNLKLVPWEIETGPCAGSQSFNN